MSQPQFAIHARAVVSKEAFEGLNVESALDGAEEGVVSDDGGEVEIKVYRRIRASDEQNARRKTNKGKLLPNVPHSVIEIISIQNLDEGL